MSEFTLMGDAFALKLATTLLHFVWQGMLLAIVAMAAGRALRHASASTRYSLNVCTLFAMLVCLPTTFFILGGSSSDSESSHNAVQIVSTDSQTRPIASGDVGPETQQSLDTQNEEHSAQASLPEQLDRLQNELFETRSGVLPPADQSGIRRRSSSQTIVDLFALAPIVAWGYFAGVLLMTVRLATGLRGGRSLRRDSSPVLDTALLAMIQTQARAIGLKCVPAVAFCEKISVPIVIGVVRPMILLPASLVSGLSPDQLQALVTHELAHIRRHDLLINLLQRIVEALLFFHPAVWFVSRRISIERENVADDVVLTAGWPAVRYADALVRMAELSSGFKTPDLTIQMSALAASGSSSSEFKRRVIRLLDQSSSSRLRLSRFGIVAMTLGIVSLLAMPVMVQLAADDQLTEKQVTPEANNAVESVAESDTAEVRQSAESSTDANTPVESSRIVKGFVTGPKGAIADVKAEVTLSRVDSDSKVGFGLDKGKPIKTFEYTTDENGRYEIKIPTDLASDPLVRVTVKLSHPKYLGRQIGPLAISDFDDKPLKNNQPYWLGRQMGRQAIRQCRLRTAHHLSGRVLLPNGEPAVGAKVKTATKYRAYSWKHHSPDDYGVSDEAITDGDGQFSIVIDESASFTAMMPGHAPLIIDDLTKRIPIANGDEPNEFRLPSAHLIRGRVVTAEGKPVPRAIIHARRDFTWNEFDMPLSFSVRCAADEMGYYKLPPLPADQYRLSIGAQLDSESRPELYNKVMGSFGTIPQPKFETQPLDLVFVPKKVRLEQFSPVSKVDFPAVSMVTLRVNVEFPDGTPDPNRQTDVGISGTFNGQEWNGQYALADENGIATLRAPKGLDWAFIKTGLARHRRNKDSDEEIGQAVHFKRLDEDVSDVSVIKPKLARLEVEVTRPLDAALTDSQKRGRISISAGYVRKGFREQSSDRQRIGLTGARQSGGTNYQATALPNEPILLTINLLSDGDRKTLHEEQLTLEPGETRVRKINLNDVKIQTAKENVRAARDRAIDFLLKQQRADGSWIGNSESQGGYVTGTTALVALALFESGDKSDEAIQKATQFLLKASPTMTKEIALQTIFLHKLGKPGAALRRRNLKWLVDSQIKKGPYADGWGYQQQKRIAIAADGANSAYAILALTTVASHDPNNPDEIPEEVWQRSVNILLKLQHEDGGWSYTGRAAQASGAMTACGLTGLKSLRSRVKTSPKIDQAISKAEAWLADNFSVDDQANSAWPLFCFEWLCRSLQDTPELGDRDWYSAVLETVLKAQRDDGSFWLKKSTVSPTVSTAFALKILRSKPVKPAI